MATIEDFFIKEYERVIAENKKLKSELDKIKSNREFGITDLGEPVNLVKVEVSTQSYFWDNTGFSKDQLEEILSLPNESFIERMKRIKREDYDYDHAFYVEKERYRYSIKVKDLDGVKQYAFDNTKYQNLVSLQFDELDTGDWFEACYLSDIEKIAVQELREAIERRIEKIEKAKAGEQDAN